MEPSEQDTDPQVTTEETSEPAVTPGEASLPPAGEPTQPAAGGPATEMTLEDAEPEAPEAPDLAAVTPDPALTSASSTSSAATNLDLPSLELPHPAYPQPQQAPPPPTYQTPGQAYGQTPYAVPEPSYGQAPAQQYSQAPYAVPEPPAPSYGQPYGYPPQQTGQQYGQQLAYTGGQLNPSEENMWSSAAHWSAILASFIGLGFLGPLIVMLTQGTKSARVRANAVESLNFEITFIISMVVSVLLIFVLVGIVTSILLPLAWLILRILAAVQTSSGQDYRYPVNIRLVK